MFCRREWVQDADTAVRHIPRNDSETHYCNSDTNKMDFITK